MPEFSFAFSYDRHDQVAWLALHGYLDGAGAQRLRCLLRTAIGGLAPRQVLVDARDLTHLDGASVHRLIHAGATTDRDDCDIVLLTRGLVRVLRRTSAHGSAA